MSGGGGERGSGGSEGVRECHGGGVGGHVTRHRGWASERLSSEEVSE